MMRGLSHTAGYFSVQTLQPVYAAMVQRALSQAVTLANQDQRDTAAKKDA